MRPPTTTTTTPGAAATTTIIVVWVAMLPMMMTAMAGKATTYGLSGNATGNSSAMMMIRPLPAAPDKQYHPYRPLFNIAHMVNSVPEIDIYLSRGANAIETDIYFAPNATPVYTFHGYPCDCFRYCGERERLDVFLERVRVLTTPASPLFDKRLLLIFLDLKLASISHGARALAGQRLAETLLAHLYSGTTPSTGIESRHPHTNGSRVRALISINHVFDYDFVLGFQNEMETRGRQWLANQFIGWDVGMNDPLFAIESMWKRLDMVYNIWQGDGRPNCVAPFYNLGRLAQIVRRRDNPSFFAIKNYIRKVYQWTVDLTVNIRTALRSDVDAIITNHPERVFHVSREHEFAPRFRMAQYSDSPWERVWTRPARPLTSSVMARPGLTLKLVNGAGDVLESLSKFFTDALKHPPPPLRQLYMAAFRKRGHRRRYYQHRRVQYRTDNNDNDSQDDTINHHVVNNSVTAATANHTTMSNIGGQHGHEPSDNLVQRLISLMVELLVMMMMKQMEQQMPNNHNQTTTAAAATTTT